MTTVRLLRPDHGDGSSSRPTLDDIAATLRPGQWVRVTWRDEWHGLPCTGTVEGAAWEHESGSLFVGTTVLRQFDRAAFGVTAIETTPRPALDLDELADLMEVYTDAQRAWEAKPLGRNGTGSNDAEQNAMYVAGQVVRDYLGRVRI